MAQLSAQETPSGSALQEFFSAFGIFALRVGLIINKLPRAAVGCGKLSPF
jgi:hypothetical protein